MKGRLPKDYEEYLAAQDSDLLLTQKSSDDTYRKVALNNAIPNASQYGSVFDYETTGAGGIWWEELGRHTLTSTADVLTVANFAERLFLKINIYVYSNGTTNGILTFNSDTGTNYSYRYSDNGAADTTATSQTGITVIGASTRVPQVEMFFVNNSTTEKVGFGTRIDAGTAGAGNAGNKQEFAYKWANTTSQITTVTYTNSSTNDFASGATLIVWGHN